MPAGFRRHLVGETLIEMFVKYRLTRVLLDKGPLNGCVCARHTICILGLKPSFSANPSHRSLSFFFRTDYMDFPDCLLLLLAYLFLLFSFSVLHFLVVVRFRAVD